MLLTPRRVACKNGEDSGGGGGILGDCLGRNASEERLREIKEPSARLGHPLNVRWDFHVVWETTASIIAVS